MDVKKKMKIISEQEAQNFWQEILKDKETAKYILTNLPEKVLLPWSYDSRYDALTKEEIVCYDLINRNYKIKDLNCFHEDKYTWYSHEIHKLPSNLNSLNEIEEFLDQKLQELGYILL